MPQNTVSFSPDSTALNDAIKRLQYDISELGQSSSLGLAKTISQMADSMAKSNQETLLAISRSMSQFKFPTTTIYFPNTSGSPSADLVGGSDLKVTGIVNAKDKAAKSDKRQFSLYFIEGNSVKYKRRTLKALSLETQHGELLKLLVDAQGQYVSDEDLLGAFEKTEVREISYILRNLKAAFKNNNLHIIIERREKSKGYVLIDVQDYNLTD